MTKHLLSTPPQHLTNLSDTLGHDDTGISITGGDHSVRGYTVAGGSFGIKLAGGAHDIVIDGFTDEQPADDGYGFYSASGGDKKLNERCSLLNFKVNIEPKTRAMHCARMYALKDPHIENWEMYHFGAYTGSSFIIKQCSGGLIRNLKTYGRPPSLGPNRTDADLSYTVSNIHIEGGVFDLNGDFLSTWKDASPFVFEAGTSNIWFHQSKFIQRNAKKAHLRCEGGYTIGNVVRLPAQKIYMDTCSFEGGSKRVDGGNPGGVKFINC